MTNAPKVTNETLFASPRFVEHPSLCYFYHTIDLPEFGLQKGGWDLRGRFEDYIGHVSLEGKRVLDVGTASGFLSFEAERLGAREVVSFDMDSAKRQTLLPFAGSEFVTDHESWCVKQTAAFETWKKSYWLTHRLLSSSAKVFYGDVYDLPSSLGQFEVIILGAILEHLVDPLSALRSVANRAAEFIVINTDYAESPLPLAFFNGRKEYPANSFIFWTYSIALYHEYMSILGFDSVSVLKNTFAAQSTSGVKMLERVALVYKRRMA